MRLSIALALALLLAATLLAQTLEEEPPEERPELNVPEPQRQLFPFSPQGPFTLVLLDYNNAVKERDYLSQALPEVVRFARESTGLEARLRWRQAALHDPGLGQALLLYMTGYDAVMRISDEEKKNLGEYLHQGGLLYAEDILPLGEGLPRTPPRGGGIAGTPFDRQLKALLRDPLVLGDQGKYWEKLAKNAPLYWAYFDFADGPPLSGALNGNVFALEALELRGRIAVIFSDLNISWYWGNLEAEGRDRSLQFGVNLVVFALTRHFAGRPLPVRR
jgi:hypothetical protein